MSIKHTTAAIVILSATLSGQPRRDLLAEVGASSDVNWLQQLAMSEAPDADLTAGRAWPRSRDLRAAAYLRLGAIGTVESVAAIKAIETALSRVSLVPTTVNVDVWPMAPSHYAESPIRAAAESVGPDGTSYRVVYWHLLGTSTLFLTSSRTPSDRNSWSRPLLIDLDLPTFPREVTLTWKDRQTATLRYTLPDQPPSEAIVSLAELRRDTDGDGWTDLEEPRLGLNPRLADSDGDGIPDGRDTCPLLAKPSQSDDFSVAVRRVFLVRFAFSRSRDAIFVTPGSTLVHLFGYGGPVLFGRDIPSDHNGRGATYVSWKLVSRSAEEMVIEMTDWENILGASGQQFVVRMIAGEWIVVKIAGGWIA